MDVKDPKKYFPSYLNYLFDKTLTWPIFREEQGVRRPCAEYLSKKYIWFCTSGADTTADEKIEKGSERIEYKKRARKVAEDNVSIGEATMKQIVDEDQNNIDLMGVERWRHIYGQFKDRIQKSEFGDQIERLLFFAEGKTPKGDEFSETMSNGAKHLISEIDTELDYMVKFMQMYLMNKEDASAGGEIK